MTWSGRERKQIAWWIRLLLVQLLLEQGLAFLDLEEDLPSSATTRTSRRQPQSRIVGGVETPPGLYPGFVYWDQGCG